MKFTTRLSSLLSFPPLLLLLEIVQKVKSDSPVCGHPGLPDGGELVSPPGPGLAQPGARAVFSAGDVVVFGCQTGRVLTGPAERECLINGSWSGVIPLCRENLALKQPSLQSSGGPSGLGSDQTNFAPTLAVDGDLNTCTYTPVSTEQRWWQVQISRTVIESVAVSITPSSLQQFTIFVIEMVEGSKALYKPCATFKGNFDEPLAMFLCNGGKGYKGEFIYIRDDREEGVGVEYFSLCEVRVFGLQESSKCGRPEESLGSLVTLSPDSGAASIRCEAGWVMENIKDEEDMEQEVGLRCEAGRWVGDRRTCREIECPDPVSPKSGYIEVSNFKGRYQFGSVATYRCNPGFILWGNDTRLCGAAGSWSGLAPSCRPVSCGPPPSLDSHTIMEMVNSSSTWRSLASYTCLPGYRDTENKTVVYSTCLTDGSWSLVALNCKYDPNFLTGSVGSWNLGESLRVNMMTVIIISACGVMFIIATIVAVSVISHRVLSSSSSSRNDPRAKQSPVSHHQLLYDQVGMMGDEEDYHMYDSHSLEENPYSDLNGKVGVIVYDDLKNPHLVEADPCTIMSSRSPALQDRRSLQSEERSSGDGGSDRSGPHYDKLGPGSVTGAGYAVSSPQYACAGGVASPMYATVARRQLRTADIYSDIRRPDGESDECDTEVYAECGNTQADTERSLSSETSSLSQATVRLAGDESSIGRNNSNSSTLNRHSSNSVSQNNVNSSTKFNNINICTNNLYAKVDVKMKKKSSPNPENKGGHQDI